MSDRPPSASTGSPDHVAPEAPVPDSTPRIAVAEAELADAVVRQVRQRRALHAMTLVALGVAAAAVLASAAPAFGRALGPGRSLAAERGIARAARAAGWAEAPIEPPSAAESSARAAEREALPGFDPLGSDRGAGAADPFGDARGARPLRPGTVGEGRADDDGSSMRLGVLREPAKIRSRPDADSPALGELPARELVVVAARTDEWALVAGTTERHNLVGWTEREKVILQ